MPPSYLRWSMTKVFVHDIIKEEAKNNKVTVDYIIGKKRDKRSISIRHYTMWRAKKETDASFTKIGKIFNRDHTSVIHAYYKLERKFQEGGVLSIRPAPPTEDVGRVRVDVPRRPWATSCGLLQLIQVDGKWLTRRARKTSADNKNHD